MNREDWHHFSHDIIDELLEDGSNPEAMYGIEHHLVALQQEVAEQAQQQAFKKGWDVTDIEQIEAEDGQIVWCFDVESECPLDEVIINEDVDIMLEFCEQNDLEYDGWGTHFEE